MSINLSKSNRIALYSFYSSCAKFIIGPITLLVISHFFDSELLGFYYIFFSIIAAQQLMEFGLGNVIRLYYSHAGDENEMNNYFSFSIVYYLISSIIFITLGYIVGINIFSDYLGSINWEMPWTLTIIAAAINNMTLPISAYLDGIQKQETNQKNKLLSSMISSLILWLSIYLGLELYSVFLYIISSAFVYFIFSVNYIKNSKLYNFEFKTMVKVFKNVWDLLKKTILVWLAGYFFWNSFNLISFKILGADVAGEIGFSIALARAGLDISSQLFISQITYISKLIALSSIKEALTIFIKYLVICSSFLIIGYSVFLLIKFQFPTLPIINKTLSLPNLVIIFFYYTLVLLLTLFNNYIRCYKIEPFVILSIFNGFFIPVSFFMNTYISLPYFTLPSLVMIFSVSYSIMIFFKQINTQRH